MNIGTVAKIAMIPIVGAAAGAAIGTGTALVGDKQKDDGITRKEAGGILLSSSYAVLPGIAFGALSTPMFGPPGVYASAAIGAATLAAGVLAGGITHSLLN